jgi:hypothetical protein
MCRLGYSANVILAYLPRCLVFLRLRPPRRRGAKRRRLQGRTAVLDAGPISNSLVQCSQRHRFYRGMLKPCSDFVTAVDSEADWPKAHDTIL